MRKLDAAQKEAAVSRYLSGEPSPRIARDLGVHSATIRDLLHRRGVRVRTNSEAQTRLPLNHAAFDVLTPEAAYWCGFIAADGAIVRGTGAPTLAIVLAKQDVGHLEKFRDFLGSGHAITPVAASGYSGATGTNRFSVRSQLLAGRLTELGVKRGPLAPELTVSRDFWRGVVDGDGWISASGREPRMEVVGYPYLLDPFVEFLGAHGIDGPSVRPHKAISRVQISSRGAVMAARALWNGCTVCLDRKRGAAASLAALPIDPRTYARGEAHVNSKLTERTVREIHRLSSEEGLSHRQIGAIFGVTHSCVGRVLRGAAWAS